MKPILFNTEMVQAILEGRKSVTRRVIKNVNSIYRPFEVGDILYVRETWCYHKTGNWYGYRADGDYRDFDLKWKPSIHMPKKAARIFLKVTDVRVERLQDMYVDDAINEGAWGNGIPHLPFSLLYAEHPNVSCNAIASFAHIWDSTIKKQDIDKCGWEANPWVWVISFERISKEEINEKI